MATQGNALAGALAASLAAIELQKLLNGDREHVASGREVLLDGLTHSLCASRLERNARCRFSHERWSPSPTRDLPLCDAFALGGAMNGSSLLWVPDESFVSRLACARCGLDELVWRLRVSLGASALRCPRCSESRSVRGFDLVERISAEQLPVPLLERPLSERGLRGGEVFGVGCGGEQTHHFVLDGDYSNPPDRGTDVLVAGCGNIGSFFAPLLARMRGVGRIVLCDPDAYEAEQVAGQDMRPRDAGRNKAFVQAERLLAIRPNLSVEAVPAPVETLPLGAFARAIAVSCLDSRAARLHLASRAWRMGRPFVDAAVGGGESLLVRTTVYVPEDGAACFECAFDASDYASLEQTYPCEAA